MFRLQIIINDFDPAFKRGTKPRLKAVVLTLSPPIPTAPPIMSVGE